MISKLGLAGFFVFLYVCMCLFLFHSRSLCLTFKGLYNYVARTTGLPQASQQ
jgi:hypothetical protein